jgi:hypothetical protein
MSTMEEVNGNHYALDEIRTAHADMEANSATGKLVVVL